MRIDHRTLLSVRASEMLLQFFLTGHDLGVFVDGILCDTLQWGYPKLDEASPATFMVGDDVAAVDSSWCFASAYLLSVALGKCLPSADDFDFLNACR